MLVHSCHFSNVKTRCWTAYFRLRLPRRKNKKRMKVELQEKRKSRLRRWGLKKRIEEKITLCKFVFIECLKWRKICCLFPVVNVVFFFCCLPPRPFIPSHDPVGNILSYRVPIRENRRKIISRIFLYVTNWTFFPSLFFLFRGSLLPFFFLSGLRLLLGVVNYWADED